MNEERAENSMEKWVQEALMFCEKCHLCNTVCPVCDTRVTQGPFGINRAIYYSIKWNRYDENLRNLVYSCTTCGRCVEKCRDVSRALKLKEVFEKVREWLLVEKMLGPMPEQVGVLKNMHVRGNPWGNPSYERTLWAKGLDIALASAEKKVDILYFVGCASSYDPQAQSIARSLATILKKAGLSFGILKEEVCSGSEARRMGETGLFEYLSQANIGMFKAVGATHIVTGDPHSFFSFTHEYQDGIDKILFQHTTQLLNDLLDRKQIKLSQEIPRVVTYHDPCYLGRHSEVFDAPRKLIGRIPGVIFTEMETHGRDSECCGMGGGRMWMEPPDGFVRSQTIAEKRVRQALATGADTLLTACPFCKITFHDALKALGKEEEMKVMDITELVGLSL